MKVSRAQAEANRRHIVAVAGQLFRERGFDGIGVADLMKAAGLTHGGFYGHFRSKEDLAVQACGNALNENAAIWSDVMKGTDGDQLRKLISFYLSDLHKDEIAKGCTIAALAPDATRQGEALRATITEGIEGFLAILGKIVPGESETERQQKALTTLCSMVGAIILSRAITDPELARHILEAAAADIMKTPT